MENDIAGKSLKEFIVSFEASLDPRLWFNLVKEEYNELEEAMENGTKAEILKEAIDLLYVTVGFNYTIAGAEQLGLLPEEEKEKMFDFLEKSGDAYDGATKYLGDLDFAEAFLRVHKSNMSKLGDDGKPIRREDGKVLKGPNYKKPELEDLV